MRGESALPQQGWLTILKLTCCVFCTNPSPFEQERAWSRQTVEVLSDTLYQLNGFRKSTSPQNRQLIVLMGNSKQEGENIVGELTFQNHSIDTFCEIRSDRLALAAVEYDRGTSHIRTPPPVGPCSSPMPRDLWRS